MRRRDGQNTGMPGIASNMDWKLWLTTYHPMCLQCVVILQPAQTTFFINSLTRLCLAGFLLTSYRWVECGRWAKLPQSAGQSFPLTDFQEALQENLQTTSLNSSLSSISNSISKPHLNTATQKTHKHIVVF
jgi:hypothetical protein